MGVYGATEGFVEFRSTVVPEGYGYGGFGVRPGCGFPRGEEEIAGETARCLSMNFKKKRRKGLGLPGFKNSVHSNISSDNTHRHIQFLTRVDTRPMRLNNTT